MPVRLQVPSSGLQPCRFKKARVGGAVRPDRLNLWWLVKPNN